MTRLRILGLAALAAATLTLGACASSGGAEDPGTSSADADADASVEDSGADDTTDDDAEDSSGSSSGPGSATVTVDGRTWEYTNYLCATGYEQTQSDVYSFSSTSFTTADGESIQVLVDVRDESGQDRLSGDGVEYEITVYDTENESVDVQASGTEGVTITESTVTVDGDFAEIDGTTYSIQINATCSD